MRKNLIPSGALVLLAAGLLLLSSCQSSPIPEEDPAAYIARIEKHRADRDNHYLTTTFSAFGLLERHYFDKEERLTIGSGPEADLKIDDPAVAAIHAVVEGLSPTPRLTAKAKVVQIENPDVPITELTLEHRTGFGLGRFHLRYNVSKSGRRNVEVYDPEHPNATGFESLEYFPVDPAYRVVGTIVPFDDPEEIEITDSHGNSDPHYLYGELHFTVAGTEQTLELYTKTLDPEKLAKDRHMLLFQDTTSGEETYPAARYLYVEGKARGQVEVDFNMAFNPSCNYSYVYTCPFPRRQNRLTVAIRAGEKYYKKHAVPIQPPAMGKTP